MKIFVRTLILILLISVLFPGQVMCRAKQKTITIVFRFDDYSSRSTTDLEVRLLDAFKKYNVPLTFGVIPYVWAKDVHDLSPKSVVPLTPLKADILRDAIKAGILEVALHGYSHQTLSSPVNARYSEFSGLDYTGQFERIAGGKNLLEKMLGIQITTFIPPWNSYDLNTIKVLEKIGFKTISADMYGVAKEFSQLRFLPETCALLDLQEAVRSARNISDNKPIIVILFHSYDFIEGDRGKGKLTYQDFIKLLTWVTSQKDIHVRTIEETTQVIGNLSSHRFIKYSSFVSSPLHRLWPAFLNKPYSTKVYLSIRAFRSMRVKYWLLFTLFYLVSLMVSIAITSLVGFHLFSKFRNLGAIAKYASLILLGLLAVYAFRDLEIYFRGAIVLTCILGVNVGIWYSLSILKEKAL